MPTVETRVQTARAQRYLDQLTDHLGRMQHGPGPGHQQTGHGGHGRPSGGDAEGGGHAGPPVARHIERTEGHAELDFDWGRFVLDASPTELVIGVHAEDAGDLTRAAALIGGRVETIGRRDHLTVTWETTESGGPVERE